MDNNPGDDDSGKRKRPADDRELAQTQQTSFAASRNDNSSNSQQQQRSRATRTVLPSFSELLRSLASHAPRTNQQLQSTTQSEAQGSVRLTPAFHPQPPLQSPTRLNFPSTSSSPIRALPPDESTGNWPPRQQGNNALPPGLTTVTPNVLDTRVDSRNTLSSATRGNAQYRIPGFQQQQPSVPTSERIAGSQPRNFQFYLADRTAPRTYRACTHCRARKVKCETDPSRDRCRRCIERGLRCSEAIPISPLVGNLLQNPKDESPTTSSTSRSVSDPQLPRSAKLTHAIVKSSRGQYQRSPLSS